MGRIALAAAGFAFVAVGFLALSRGGDGRPGSGIADHDARIGRSAAYFREIGSWPRLGDGHDGFAVAEERCAWAATAF